MAATAIIVKTVKPWAYIRAVTILWVVVRPFLEKV